MIPPLKKVAPPRLSEGGHPKNQLLKDIYILKLGPTKKLPQVIGIKFGVLKTKLIGWATVVSFLAPIETEQQRKLMRAIVVLLDFLEGQVIAVVEFEHVHVRSEQKSRSAARACPYGYACDKAVVNERAKHVEVNL